MKRWLVMLGMFTLLFNACDISETGTEGLPTKPAGDKHEVIEVPEQTKDTSVSPTEVPAPNTPTPGPSSQDSELTQVGLELQLLVEDDLALVRGSLTIISVEAKTWRDASLGCPEPGMVYAQVLTEGWLVVYGSPEGVEIPVHADRGLQNYAICNADAQPTPKEEFGDLQLLPVLKAATTLAAEKLDVSIEEVAVSEITTKMWNNSCLGCAGPEEKCLAVITPGYQVVLVVDGLTYSVHTNADGTASRLCEKSDSPNPGGD